MSERLLAMSWAPATAAKMARARRSLSPGLVHDTRLRGQFSKSSYQIDSLVTKESDTTAGEAKDYTVKDSKVGRPDLQKLGGALPELPVQGGVFFSATGYTKPAQQYAGAAKDITGKPIKLFHLRETTDKDLEGRVLSIHINFRILLPDYARAQFQPLWTHEGLVKAQELVTEGRMKEGQQLAIDSIYDAQGNVLTTIVELTRRGFEVGEDKVAASTFTVAGGHLQISGTFVPIQGIAYKIPFTEDVMEFVIKAEGEAVLLLKEDGGGRDKIITTVDLKKFRFDANGEVIVDSSI